MKADTERKKYHSELYHKRKNRMHVHLSKELRLKLKTKRRSVQIHKSDSVKILRGDYRGKEAKVSRVSLSKRKIYLEGMIVKNSRGKEVSVPFEPSNLLLIKPQETKERKLLFSEEIFKKEKEQKVETPPQPEVEAATQKSSEPNLTESVTSKSESSGEDGLEQNAKQNDADAKSN